MTRNSPKPQASAVSLAATIDESVASRARLSVIGPTVFEWRVPFKRAEGWQTEVLCQSDLHWDSPDCDRRLLARHLDQARARGAPIWWFGDTLDAMGGKNDRRSHKQGVRPEHQVDNYYDALVTSAGEWFAPYADNLALYSDGNHETAVTRHTEANLTERVCERLRVHHGGHVQAGEYKGWIIVRLVDGKHQQTMRIAYDHGSGGGGPVTRGVIQTNRRAVDLPDADVIFSGHIHERWFLESPRVRVSEKGVISRSEQLHVQLATYKEERLSGKGYHVEKGRGLKPLGGFWLRLYYSTGAGRVLADVIRTDR